MHTTLHKTFLLFFVTICTVPAYGMLKQPLCDITNIFEAAKNGELERVKTLINAGANVNEKNLCDWTPLHFATREGHESIVSLLLDAGAHVNEKNKYGWIPLHLAAMDNYELIAALLIKTKANINVKDKSGFTPLHFAAINNYESIAALLIKANADINEKDKSDWTPLHFAARRGNESTILSLLTTSRKPILTSIDWVTRHKQEVRTMLHIKNNENKTAYDIALEKGHQKIATMLNPDNAQQWDEKIEQTYAKG